ncbi:Transcription factor GT-2 [Handroanthus impetiginosus]|uniref:Transcription factor GT-2 n=1 Tax=Handroanthus impetiginosus TaxID=429701 RepID=A0A2G9HQS6_9LAMI|nr:Transcription factor GT-2 [Handroanthus impetiginosus]
MDPGHHHQHHHHQLHQQYSIETVSSSGDRFPQWSIQETRDFLVIRAELDPTFMETKRNKPLWEVISTRMKEKGYSRSAEQCKCKWKNLVTRYKGCETMEAEGMRQQFPFYSELQTIFAARMQRMLWLEAEGAGAATPTLAQTPTPTTSTATTSRKKPGTAHLYVSSDEEDDQNDDSDGGGPKKKRKTIKGNHTNTPNITNSNMMIINGIREVMEEFTKQQMQIEMQWLKAYEEKEEERRLKEMEWRQRMEALENERIMMERRWREREEQRKIREEARAEKRDALITALLNKLRREDSI